MALDFSQILPTLPSLIDGMTLTLKLLVMAVAGLAHSVGVEPAHHPVGVDHAKAHAGRGRAAGLG